ncbi:MAG: tetratricopeptide repeat protein [Kiloniellaceae bacterium]
MMTGAIGRHLLRFAAMVALAGFAVGCASSQGPAITAPAGYGKDPASRVARLVQYCDRLAEKGELVTALGLCARAHEMDPDDPEPMMKVASILQTLNRQEAAAATYVAVLERHPKHHEARYRLGKIYMESGEGGLATAQFNQALRGNPADPRAYNALGILRDQEGEHEAAQSLYRQALERDPGNVSVRNNLGLSLALDGKRDEAIEVLAELSVDPLADQTVLRNLEAAYTSGVALPQPDGPLAEPAEPAAAVADPVVPVASEPLEQPDAKAVPMRAPNSPPMAPEAGAPTPLFLPPAAQSEEPKQSGLRAPEAASDGPPASAILAAAERLMQAPDWADFEPGALINPAVPPQSEPAEEAGAEPLDLDNIVWPSAFRLTMMMMDGGAVIA